MTSVAPIRTPAVRHCTGEARCKAPAKHSKNKLLLASVVAGAAASIACLSASAGVVTSGTVTCDVNASCKDIAGFAAHCDGSGAGQFYFAPHSTVSHSGTDLGPWDVPVIEYVLDDPDPPYTLYIDIDSDDAGATVGGSSSADGNSIVLEATFTKPSWEYIDGLIYTSGVTDYYASPNYSFNASIKFVGDLELSADFTLCDTSFVDLYAFLHSGTISVDNALSLYTGESFEIAVDWEILRLDDPTEIGYDTVTVTTDSSASSACNSGSFSPSSPLDPGDYRLICHMYNQDDPYTGHQVWHSACQQVYDWSELDQATVTLTAYSIYDLDHSGAVDSGDLGWLLLFYGPCPGCPEDLDGSGVVDSGDLGLLILNYGDCGSD